MYGLSMNIAHSHLIHRRCFCSSLVVVLQKSSSVCNMVHLLGLVLVVESVGSLRRGSLRRKSDNSTAGSVHINPQLVDVMTLPDEDTRRTRFHKSSYCDQSLVETIPSIPCDTLSEVITLIQNSLDQQGGQAAFEAITFGVLTGISQLAEAGSLLKQVTTPNVSLPATQTLKLMFDNKIQAEYSQAEQTLMWKCCGCDDQEMTVAQCTSSPCYIAALTVYKKVTHKHPVVKTAASVSGKIALGAAIAGVVLDIGAGGSSMGGGTMAAAHTAFSMSMIKNFLNVGHVVTSCVQKSMLVKCQEYMCRTG